MNACEPPPNMQSLLSLGSTLPLGQVFIRTFLFQSSNTQSGVPLDLPLEFSEGKEWITWAGLLCVDEGIGGNKNKTSQKPYLLVGVKGILEGSCCEEGGNI